MEQYRTLVAQRDATIRVDVKKDKCADAKRAQREVRDALKSKRADELEKRREEQDAKKHVIRDERLFNGPTSRRAREDLRRLEKKAAREEVGSLVCEHGINKCRICFPVAHNKQRSHRTDSRAAEGDDCE